MKKILLVALALCLSYGFAYSCLFNHSINLTTKMQNFETDSFTTKNGKSLKITFFKHASLLIEYAGKSFLLIQSLITQTLHSNRKLTIS